MDADAGLELAGPWSSFITFVALFLVSISYSVAITVYKVGRGARGHTGKGGLRPLHPQMWEPQQVSHAYCNVPRLAA